MRRQRNKPDPAIHTARIDNLSHDGKGIARIDGKATFIQGALPGELIEFQYTRVKKDLAEGRLISVIEPSASRIEPKCPHYQLCGGCSLQHMREEEQIQFKEEQLIDLLTRYGHTEAKEILPPLISGYWNYRNKARLSVRYVEKKQKAMVGFRERHNPRLITDIQQCPILNAKVDKDIPALCQLIDSLDDKHTIAQIELAAGDEEIGLIFRNLNPLSDRDKATLIHFAKENHYKLFLQPSGPDSIYCLYPETDDHYLYYSLAEYQIRFAFHPTDFTQVNSSLNALMVKQALSLMDIKSTDKVLDLFCGLGNFSLPMAKHCAEVIGVEGSQAMVDRAYMNATSNQISNVQFYAANLDDPKEIQKLAVHKVNKMLIDPPRSGALELVKLMGLFTPERIVYVSCNPVTLARDTDILVNQQGYTLMKAGVMDMFPHTAHVESIALFIKG